MVGPVAVVKAFLLDGTEGSRIVNAVDPDALVREERATSNVVENIKERWRVPLRGHELHDGHANVRDLQANERRALCQEKYPRKKLDAVVQPRF